MFGWFWRFRRDRGFLRHPNGVAEYADRAAAVLVADAFARLQKVQTELHETAATAQGTAKLIQQKWNKLRGLADASAPGSMPVSREEYEVVRRRVQRHVFMILALVTGEAFLNYLSLLVIITAGGIIFEAVRLVVAVVLTLLAILVFDYLFRAYLSKTPQPLPEKVLSAVLVVVTLGFICGITLARARDFEGSDAGGIGFVGMGFILASLVLPVVGGWMYYEREGAIPLYHRLRQWRRAMVDLRRLETKLGSQVNHARQLLKTVDADFQEQINRWYGGLVEFRVKKGVMNAGGRATADTGSVSFAETQQAFKKHCESMFIEASKSILAEITNDIDTLEELRARSIESREGELVTQQMESDSGSEVNLKPSTEAAGSET